MSYRLSNENDPSIQVCITSETWYGILNLAEEFGWNPMGEILPGQWEALDLDLSFLSLSHGNGDWDESSLVVWEDALNLADALEKAFLAYEPVRVPASFFVFDPQKYGGTTRPNQSTAGSASQNGIHHPQKDSQAPFARHKLAQNLSPTQSIDPQAYQSAYPSLGAMRLVIELCQSGPFRVERFQRGQGRPNNHP